MDAKRLELVTEGLPFPQSEFFARIIWQSTMAAWRLCLGGKSWPAKDRQYEIMKNPQPGDMVVEHSAGLRSLNCADAVGWLIKSTREPIPFDDCWDEAEDGPLPTERVFYIRTIEGTEMRWVNADFLQVPKCEGWWDAERWKDKGEAALRARAHRSSDPLDAPPLSPGDEG